MNSPATFESLPQELRDLIVDHISQIPGKSERIRALSSIALVSRRFRYWAHKRLFAVVALRGGHGPAVVTAFSRLSELKELIIADPHSEMTGIASHIRSFALSLCWRRSYVVPPLVECDALPFIFRKIYRNSYRACSLSISFFAPVDKDQLDWLAFGHDFRSALLDIVRSARLSTLRLRGISNLPDDILSCSSINHINFKNISIQHYTQSDCGVSNVEPASCGRRSYRNCIQPYSIETDHSFPISHILDFTQTHLQSGPLIFQRLRKLTIKINDSDGFTKTTELFKSTTSIENLEIKFNCISSSRAALSFQPLRVLRYLRLVHRRHTPRFITNSPHGAVQDMINLLSYSQLPRSLCGMAINITLTPFYGNCFYPETPSSGPTYQGGTESATDGINADQILRQAGRAGALVTPGVVGDPGNASHPAKSVTSATSSTPSTMTIIKRIFASWSPENNNLKPLDDLLGDTSIESRDRFASINYLILRLKVEVHRVPREYAMNSEQEFAEQAARYVRLQFFPKMKERFARVDQSSGGFWVVVLPRLLR